MNFLQKLRQRPEEERSAFAAIVAGGVALVLFLIWGMVSFRSVQNANMVTLTQKAPTSKNVKELTQSVGSMTSRLITQYKDLQAAIRKSSTSASNQKNGTIPNGINKSERTNDVVLGPSRMEASTSSYITHLLQSTTSASVPLTNPKE